MHTYRHTKNEKERQQETQGNRTTRDSLPQILSFSSECLACDSCSLSHWTGREPQESVHYLTPRLMKNRILYSCALSNVRPSAALLSPCDSPPSVCTPQMKGLFSCRHNCIHRENRMTMKSSRLLSNFSSQDREIPRLTIDRQPSSMYSSRCMRALPTFLGLLPTTTIPVLYIHHRLCLP